MLKLDYIQNVNAEVFGMGEVTDGILKQLEESDEYPEFIEGLIDENFVQEFAKLIEKSGLSGDKLAAQCKVSKTYINKIRSEGQKREPLSMCPDKYVIVEICLVCGATLDEINHILKLAGKGELYSRNEEDSVIIWGIKHNKTCEQIKMLLHNKGYDTFD